MKKLNFKWLVVLCMAMGIVNAVKAQVQNSEVMFFENTQGSSIRIVRIVDGKLLTDVSKGWTKSKIKNNLKSSPNYYDNYPNGIVTGFSPNHSVYVYDETLSTSSRIVYVKDGYGNRFCFAISPDMSSLVYFVINRDGEVNDGQNEYYIHISKEDLLPKTFDPNELDFLNE